MYEYHNCYSNQVVQKSFLELTNKPSGAKEFPGTNQQTKGVQRPSENTGAQWSQGYAHGFFAGVSEAPWPNLTNQATQDW